jgi:hypothetical protein
MRIRVIPPPLLFFATLICAEELRLDAAEVEAGLPLLSLLKLRRSPLASSRSPARITHAESASAEDPPIRFATHDTALAAAARAAGFGVLGG